jgi:hypothetical protein
VRTIDLGENLSQCHCIHHKYHMDWPGQWLRPATKRLSHGRPKVSIKSTKHWPRGVSVCCVVKASCCLSFIVFLSRGKQLGSAARESVPRNRVGYFRYACHRVTHTKRFWTQSCQMTWSTYVCMCIYIFFFIFKSVVM